MKTAFPIEKPFSTVGGFLELTLTKRSNPFTIHLPVAVPVVAVGELLDSSALALDSLQSSDLHMQTSLGIVELPYDSVSDLHSA